MADNPRRAPRIPRSGISLMEVLISIFVISIGLLGVAALIPVANYALMETSKADRSAACGQAAMRDVRVRRLVELIVDDEPLLDGHTVVVDPLGFANGDDRGNFGNLLTRSHLYRQERLGNPTVSTFMTLDEARRIFHGHDDLLFDMREGTSLRPVGFADHGDAPMPERSYSWFFTVSPSASEDETAHQNNDRTRFTVSAVVCQGRDFTTPERPFAIAPGGVFGVVDPETQEMLGMIAGLRVLIPRSEPDRVQLDTGQWILLVGTRLNQATGDSSTSVYVAEWYRVAAGSEVDDADDVDNYTYYLAVDGPAWPSPLPPNNVVVVPGVLGVYTTTFELNRSPDWLR